MWYAQKAEKDFASSSPVVVISGPEAARASSGATERVLTDETFIAKLAELSKKGTRVAVITAGSIFAITEAGIAKNTSYTAEQLKQGALVIAIDQNAAKVRYTKLEQATAQQKLASYIESSSKPASTENVAVQGPTVPVLAPPTIVPAPLTPSIQQLPATFFISLAIQDPQFPFDTGRSSPARDDSRAIPVSGVNVPAPTQTGELPPPGGGSPATGWRCRP